MPTISFIWKRQIQEATAAFLATAIEMGIGMSEGLWSSFDRRVENAIDWVRCLNQLEIGGARPLGEVF